MDVILLETVPKLGKVGDIVTVKNGYARNFLIPRKHALLANAAAKAYFETQKSALEEQDAKKHQDATSISKRLEGISVVLIRQAGDSGRLYGSVTSVDIARKISEKGEKISRGNIRMDSIKDLGLFDVNIVLHGGVSCVCKVNVARSEEEAQLQEKLGGALSQEEKEARADKNTPAATDTNEADIKEATDIKDTEATEADAS